jgi:hypothetical protein
VSPVTNEIIIYDLEYTTWQGALERNWSKENEFREITWIAAIRVDVDTLQETDAFDCIVKPTLNPVLSDYFTDLTGLTQQRSDKEGRPFIEAMRAFKRFVDSRPTVCHGWDAISLLENFKLKNLRFRAKRMGDGVPILLNLDKNGNRQKGATVQAGESLTVEIYGSDMNQANKTLKEVVYEVDLDHPGRFVSPCLFTCFNIKPWFNTNAPETIGKYAGELATVFEQFSADGKVHEPLFDVRSILQGARHLIDNRGADNIFKKTNG